MHSGIDAAWGFRTGCVHHGTKRPPSSLGLKPASGFNLLTRCEPARGCEVPDQGGAPPSAMGRGREGSAEPAWHGPESTGSLVSFLGFGSNDRTNLPGEGHIDRVNDYLF